ncbi:ureohydrolase, partial [Kipferlia bialata]
GTSGDIVIVGFPYDEGVRRNGGRSGASEGPSKFREVLRRTGAVVNPVTNVDLSNISITDAGDIQPGLELERAHTLLAQIVERIVSAGGVPFVVGGGHDIGYPDCYGAIKGLGHGDMGVINVDSHFDVRPLKQGRVHSGCPFRLLLESEEFTGSFVEFGAQSHQCCCDHRDYILGCNQIGRVETEIHWLDNMHGDVIGHFDSVLQSLNLKHPSVCVSFDMDAIRASDMPGVSCPAPIGLTTDDALHIAEVCIGD